MAVKTITVTEDAYRRIAGIKVQGESFSDLFTRLASNKSAIWKYFGILSSKEADDLLNYVKGHRRQVTKDMEERYARLRQLSADRNNKRQS